MKIDKKTAELTAIGAVAAAAIVLYWNTYSFMPSMLPGYPGDAFFPRIILTFILACSIAAAVEIVAFGAHEKERGEPRSGIGIDIVGIAAVAAAVIVYVIALSYVAFEISTFVFVLALLTPALTGSRMIAVAKAAGIAAVTVLVLYFCFVILLDVDFPLLFLPRYVHF